MALRGTYSKQSIPKGGGVKQLPIGKIKAPILPKIGSAPRPAKLPRMPGYFGKKMSF